jgi:hypothetical protein
MVDERPRVYWDAEQGRIRMRPDDEPAPSDEVTTAAKETAAAETAEPDPEPLDVWLRRTRRRARTR